jgi:hypothetical protein
MTDLTTALRAWWQKSSNAMTVFAVGAAIGWWLGAVFG